MAVFYVVVCWYLTLAHTLLATMPLNYILNFTLNKRLQIEDILFIKSYFEWKTTASEYLTDNSEEMFQRFQNMEISTVDAVYYVDHRVKKALRFFFEEHVNVIQVFRQRGDPPMYVAIHGIFAIDPLAPFDSSPRGYVYLSYDPRVFVRDVFERRCLRWNSLFEYNLYMRVKDSIEKEDGTRIVEEDNNVNASPTRMLLQLLCIESIISGKVRYEEKLPTRLRKNVDTFCQMRALGLDFIWRERYL